MQKSKEMTFYRELSYEFGKEMQRLETENAELKKQLNLYNESAVPKEMQKRPVCRPVVKKKYYKPILPQEDKTWQSY